MGITIIILFIQLHALVRSQDPMFFNMGPNPTVGNPSSASTQTFRDTGSVPTMRNPETEIKTSTAVETLPMCANLMCTLEFIPEECRNIPVLLINGVQCRGCSAWSENCRNKQPELPVRNPDVNPPPEVTCPILDCIHSAIPPGCEYVETYDYFGRTCEKCPVWRSGCSESGGQVVCPVQRCTMEYIPPQCEEVPTYNYMGRKCEGCPQRKKGCNPEMFVPGSSIETLKAPEIPEIACPFLDCGERIPPECQESQTYEINSRICDACPTWKLSCKPLLDNNMPGEVPKMACPLLKCPGNIPEECREQQPYELQGQVCYNCPTWKVGCVPSNQIGGTQKACPLVRCEPLDVPFDCLEDSYYIFEGQLCQGCPTVKPECEASLNPMPLGTLDQALTETVDMTLVDGCPPQKCPLIYIPPECEERESYLYEGNICYKCPTRRKDCIEDAVRCPPTPCPLIYIPPECEEKQPYLYQGQTCYRCPKRKEGCVPHDIGETRVEGVVYPWCPNVQCPLILIPEECEEKQIFQYGGHTCYGCPKWRKGCSPKNSNMHVPDINKISCPLFSCPSLYIPSDCLEEQPYEFQGKTCYMCPKWKIDCIPLHQRAISTGGLIGNTPTSNQDPSFVPIAPIVSDESTTCPLFKCPRIRIPTECIDNQPFDFNGKTCFKCPIWRLGCVPNTDSTSSGSSCPALLNCPKVEIPSECREETPYVFHGHTCFGCPKFREGCVPNKQTVDPGLPCPLMACPRIYIPPECKEEHPYDFQGKTCFKCPTLKTPCNQDQQPKIECPLLDCPDVRIPEECMEVKTYKFQGQTCNKCPSWKFGCSPSVPVVIKDGLQEASSVKPTAEIPGLTGTVCPVPKCPRIRIPEECKLVQSYEFQGKTCHRCPVWRPGCLPGSSSNASMSATTKDKSNETQLNSPSELTPMRFLFETSMATISCPTLRCLTSRIPVHCQQQTTYMYMGKMCIGCPTWSWMCDSRDTNRNGLLALTLFKELMLQK